jgi:hypothetical protein
MSEFPDSQLDETAPPPTPPPDQPPVVNAGDITSGSTVLGTQNINVVMEGVDLFYDGQPHSTARRFSDDDVSHVLEEREHELKALHVGHAALIEPLLAALESEHVVFLTGDRGIGKRTTALYLATRITEAHKFERCTAVIKALGPQVHFQLRNITADAKFANRVIVFDDALAKKNANLSDLFAGLERVACDQMIDELRRKSSYVIFTVASDDFSAFRQQLGTHLHVRELTALTRAVVEEGFERKVAWIVPRSGVEKHVEQLGKARQRLLDKFKTLPRLAVFIDNFLNGEPDIDAALDQFDNAAAWFTTVLAADFDAWCFALALVLAQATREPAAVAWLDFERLRRALSEQLKSDEELFPPWSRKPDGEQPKRTTGQSLHDQLLHARASARVESAAEGIGHVVQFGDLVSAATLWKTLLTQNRRVLTAVIPALRTIAEQDRAADRIVLRATAAQALGRIGELDPERITFPLIRHWANSANRGPLVGRLMQGVLGSGSASYQAEALRELDLLAKPEIARGKDNAQTRLLTAIAAYSQIGVYEPAMAMERLGTIAIERIAPAVESFNQITRDAAIAAREAADAPSKRLAGALRKQQERLARLARVFRNEYTPAVFAMGRTVAQICVLKDPVKTLTAMRDWISKGGPATGSVVALLFLLKIADDLGPAESSLPDSDTAIIFSPLLFSMATAGKDAVPQMAGFLADVHASLHGTFALPSEMQRDLQGELSECLTDWARAAVASPFYGRSVEDLFVTLGTVRGGAIRKDVYNLLATSSFAETDRMHSFAVAVRRRLGA